MNKILWRKGESIAEIYGIPSNEKIRIAFPEESKIIVPEEDPSLTLYRVNKQKGENPLQTKTLWTFLPFIEGGGLLLLLFGLPLLLWEKRQKKKQPPFNKV